MKSLDRISKVSGNPLYQAVLAMIVLVSIFLAFAITFSKAQKISPKLKAMNKKLNKNYSETEAQKS